MAILTTTDLGGDAVYALVDHDPAATPTDVPAGSMILQAGTGIVYQKLDDGPSTNVAWITQEGYLVQTSGSIALATPTRHVIVYADTTSGPLTVTLWSPAASPRYRARVKKVGGPPSNRVTIATPSGSIDGESDVDIIVLHDSLDFEPDGSDWWIH